MMQGESGCKKAGRRPNRPPDGFGGRSPPAPVEPGRPAARIRGHLQGGKGQRRVPFRVQWGQGRKCCKKVSVPRGNPYGISLANPNSAIGTQRTPRAILAAIRCKDVNAAIGQAVQVASANGTGITQAWRFDCINGFHRLTSSPMRGYHKGGTYV